MNKLTVENVAIAVSSCDRQPLYIHQSIATMFTDPLVHRLAEISITVDGPDKEYLRDYGHLKGKIEIRTLSGEDAEIRQGKSPHFGCAYNFYRCVRDAPKAGGGVLVVEDDILLRADWVSLLCNACNEMRDDGIRDYILSVNTRSKVFVDVKDFQRGVWYTSYGGPFYGTQGIFIPDDYRDELLEDLRHYNLDYSDEEARKTWCPLDIKLGQIASRIWETREERGRAGGMYATTADLAEHIGLESTGLGGGDYYSSKSFEWTLDEIIKRSGKLPYD